MRHSSDASVCCKSSDYRYCSLSNSKRECRVFTNERWMRISNGSWSLSFHQIFLNKCLWKCTHSVKQPWDGHGISNEWWRLNTSIYSSDFCGSLFHKVGFSIKFIIFGGFVGFNCIMFALQPLLEQNYFEMVKNSLEFDIIESTTAIEFTNIRCQLSTKYNANGKPCNVKWKVRRRDEYKKNIKMYWFPCGFAKLSHIHLN